MLSVSEEHFTRTEDKIDARWIADEWRRETEPAARRAGRYNTALTAYYGWIYMDRFREWSRHRGKEAWQ